MVPGSLKRYLFRVGNMGIGNGSEGRSGHALGEDLPQGSHLGS